MITLYERRFLKALQEGLGQIAPHLTPEFKSHDYPTQTLMKKLVDNDIATPVFFTEILVSASGLEENTDAYTLVENGEEKTVSIDLRKAIPFRLRLKVHILSLTRDDALLTEEYLTKAFAEPQTLLVEHPYNFYADIGFAAIFTPNQEVSHCRKSVTWCPSGTVYEVAMTFDLRRCILFPESLKGFAFDGDRTLQTLAVKLIAALDARVRNVRTQLLKPYYEYDEDGEIEDYDFPKVQIAVEMFNNPAIADAPTMPDGIDDRWGCWNQQRFEEVRSAFLDFRKTPDYRRMIEEHWREAADNLFDAFGQIPHKRRNVELRESTANILRNLLSTESSLEDIINKIVGDQEAFSADIQRQMQEHKEEDRRRAQAAYEAEMARREERRAARNLYASPLCQLGKRNPRTGKLVRRCIDCELWFRCDGCP